MTKEKKTIYVTGKELSLLDGKKEKFISACRFYEERGFDIINPYELKDIFFPTLKEELNQKEVLGLDFYFLSRADVVVVLDDWQESSIAPYEIAFATKFKMPIVRAFSFERIYLDFELTVEEVNFNLLFNTLDEELGLEKCKVRVLCD